MAAAIEFYRDRLGFTVERGGPEDGNVALSFGDARIMLDSVPTEYYSRSYNEAIAKRMRAPGPTAVYIESPDLETVLGKRDRAILELLYGAGIRVSELCGLDLEDVGERGVVLLAPAGPGRLSRASIH